MKKYNVGSLVVISNDADEEILGIFTERDLIHKIDLIQGDPNWSRPIQGLMTVPVHTLPIDKLGSAVETMIRHRIRHLPIVYKTAENKTRLAGIVTMRDLFTFMHTKHIARPAAGLDGEIQPSMGPVGFIADEPELEELFSFLFSSLYGIQLKRILLADSTDISTSLDEITETGLLIFDIDNWEMKDWAKALKTINQKLNAPFTIIAMSPSRHDKKAEAILQQLSQNPKFLMFTKPVDVVLFFRKLTEKVPALGGGLQIQDLLNAKGQITIST